MIYYISYTDPGGDPILSIWEFDDTIGMERERRIWISRTSGHNDSDRKKWRNVDMEDWITEGNEYVIQILTKDEVFLEAI